LHRLWLELRVHPAGNEPFIVAGLCLLALICIKANRRRGVQPQATRLNLLVSKQPMKCASNPLPARGSHFLLSVAVVFLLLPATPCGARAAQAARTVIATPRQGSSIEILAAREVQRYVYLRTGRVLRIQETDGSLPRQVNVIAVGQRDQALIRDGASQVSLPALGPESYWLKTVDQKDRQILLVTGADPVGTLYAAYRLAEHLGIRFYLHGDVIPGTRVDLKLPVLDEVKKPLFKLRGIQPFHDFPEGPDWWNTDDYLAIISQLPKLRMNFLGLHTYPEGNPNAEPTVWIGLREEIGEGGNVKASYPSSYQNTLRGNWGYSAKQTGDFAFGAGELFDRDDYGADVMRGACPQPTTPELCNGVFDRAAAMLSVAFDQARRLGVKTCVGTETPLTIPKQVQDRLKAQGKDPQSSVVLQALYQGIFEHAAKTYRPDYYWFWTPEGWTWEGTKDAQVKRTLDDLLTAFGAAKKLSAPLQLATCGWVLGPQQDRALFDKALPKQIAVSCINREVGRTPVDKGFAEVSGRGKWAIPWMEDDPALTSPQLWAGRMRRDAADALRYGCDGLMGIHWRTRVLGPNVAALAQAAWDQGKWATPTTDAQPMAARPVAGPVGGQVAGFAQPIADTEDAPLYQTVRYNLSAYRLRVADGPCTVTLKFCEPHYKEAGKRVFDVKVQGQPVITNLDIFAKVGQNRALDYTFRNIQITNGWLNIDFVPRVEFPLIAAISVEGVGSYQRINCGGPSFKDYVADLPSVPEPAPAFAPTDDFYLDWAEHEFGTGVGRAAAAIFVKVDCRLPRPSDWVNGPGGLKPDSRPWDTVQRDYQFVDEFASLKAKLSLAERARFEYWVDTFAYMKAMAHVDCTWAEYNRAMEKVKAEKDPAAQKRLARDLALPVRRDLVKQVGEVYDHLLALVSNPGELGTVANWDQHLLPDLLTKPGEELAKVVGEPLPEEALVPKAYRGLTRVIVPTVRSSAATGESLSLKVIILAKKSPRQALVQWRPIGAGKFKKVPLHHQARGVYSAQLPSEAAQETAFEYNVWVIDADGKPVFFPASAPAINQTVVVTPERSS
jgi:Malectin domain/Glycosyl hydrolase family 67 N-terminus